MSEDHDRGDLRVVETVSDEDFQTMRGRLRAFNDEHSEYHRQSRQPGHGPQPIGFLLYDTANELAAGITGHMIWGWLRVDRLWVAERLRGQGLGRLLLARLEAEASRRGCRRVELRTFRFQAPGFYEKLGYRVVGTLEGFPPDGAFYWMAKELPGCPAPS